MTDLVIPSALRYARSQFRYIDQTGVTRGLYTGAVQTTSFGGDRVGCTIDFTPHGGRTSTEKSYRAQLQAFLMSLRGKQNRVYAEDSSNDESQGSFPATELFSNTSFTSTSDWTALRGSVTAVDGVLMLTVSGSAANPLVRQAVSLTINAPHVLRSILIPGRRFADGAFSYGVEVGDGVSTASSLATTATYRVASMVAESTSSTQQYPLVVSTSTGYQAGDAVSIAFTSLSRCFLVDGGGNYLLRSDEIDNASWSKVRSSVSGSPTTAPDLTVTGDLLVEDTSNNTHYTTQGSLTVPTAAADFQFTVFCRSNSRNFVYISIDEATGGTSISQYFNLSTGAVGASGSTGANWANRRAFIRDAGNSWYACTIVGRKTNAATTLSATVGLASADGTGSYLGVGGTTGVALWRATLTQSGVPSRLTQSTSAAVAVATQTGSGLYVKGLPASTAGLLKRGRWIEIDGQLKMVTESLDSDSAGRGYLQFSPPLRRAVSDNTPVIVCRPMGRFMFAGDNPRWDNVPGVISNSSIDLEEAWA